MKGYDVCLALKAVKHKPYGDLLLLPMSIHHWKDLSIDFITRLPVSTNWKGKTYNSILVIVDQLTKMIYYKPVKITINAFSFIKVIIDVVLRHYGLPYSIISNQGSIFILKFWLLLCYFLGIK